jgi:hypothetical protein
MHMRIQNPFVVSDNDKKKLADAGKVIADAVPTVNVSWKPGRAALTAIGKVIPSVSISWSKAQEAERDLTPEEREQLNK